MTSSRQTKLLWEASRELEDGRDPLLDAFLVKHDVTLDEAYTLSEQLALAAKMLIVLSSHEAWLKTFGYLVAETVALDIKASYEEVGE